VEEKSMFPIPIDYIIDTENLVVIGDKIDPCSGRKLPRINHGIGWVGENIVDITCIGKQIEINSIMDLIKLFHLEKRYGITVRFYNLKLQVV
jgi:hypothetical protein